VNGKLRNKETDRLVEIGDPACQMAVDIGWTTEGIDRKKMESPVSRAHGYPPAICRKTDIMDDARSSASPEIVEPGRGLQGEYSSDLSVVGDRKEGTAVGRESEMGDGLGVRSGEMGQAEGCGIVEQGRQVKNRDMISRWRKTSGDALGNQSVVGRLKQRSRFKWGRGICKETTRKCKDRVCQGKRRQTLERLATQHMQSTRRRLIYLLVSNRISLYSFKLTTTTNFPLDSNLHPTPENGYRCSTTLTALSEYTTSDDGSSTPIHFLLTTRAQTKRSSQSMVSSCLSALGSVASHTSTVRALTTTSTRRSPSTSSQWAQLMVISVTCYHTISN